MSVQSMLHLLAADSAKEIPGGYITTGILIALLVIGSIAYGYSEHKAAQAAKRAKASPRVDKTPVAAAVPVSPRTQEISEEVLAVISAAVAAMAPEGTHYAVRTVSRSASGSQRAHGSRPVWAAAGLAESTRPF